jgi:ABC-2 type transport system ATP-binding protein
MLMNLIRATAGRAAVLGTASERLAPRDLSRIGYVSENQRLPEWMTVEQLLAFCKPFYPTWDEALCEELKRLFGLPANQKLRHFSRGMKMKAAMLSALAYRPRLLVLDEPFSGLDPVVRDEIVEALLELSNLDRWTIFVSSHDISEIENLADHVGFLRDGELVL